MRICKGCRSFSKKEDKEASPFSLTTRWDSLYTALQQSDHY